jgi:hypothetical protein
MKEKEKKWQYHQIETNTEEDLSAKRDWDFLLDMDSSAIVHFGWCSLISLGSSPLKEWEIALFEGRRKKTSFSF